MNDKTLTPACSISEEEGSVAIVVEMPGVAKDNIEVKIEKNDLIISGRRQEETSEGRFLLRERGAGNFRKIFTLDESIDRDHVEASVEKGILQLTLRIREAAKPKQIAIEAR